MQEDKDWMKFEQSGRVSDYLEYCAKSRNRWESDSPENRNEDDETDGAQLYADGYGADFHAGGRI